MPPPVRTLASVAAGALVAVGFLVATYQSRSGISFDMDGEAPPFSSGFYDGERDGSTTFAWTGTRAVVRLAGLDRRGEWTCHAGIRAARPAEFPIPTVTLSADDSQVSATPSGGAFTDLVLVLPSSNRAGLVLALTTTPVFTPGGGDPRALGVQVDRMACAPAAGWLLPPIRAFYAVAMASAAFGLVALAAGLGTLGVFGITGLAGAAVAMLMVTGGGAFGGYPALVQSMVMAVALAGALGAIAARRLVSTGRPVALAILAAAVAYAFELLALSHPGKDLVDAVFQAHRLGWVMGGRYFFTQPLPDGVAFPYAIGMYVTAVPLARIIDDHVLVVRAVALLAHGVAGFALFWIVARQWRQTWAGLVALVLYHVVPLGLVVIGNANLPNVFAQSVAVVALVASTRVWAAETAVGRIGQLVLVTATLALAFLSHVSTFALLGGTMAAVVVVHATLGGRAGRRTAAALIVAVGVALLLAVALYYRHFPEVYARALARVTVSDAVPPVAPAGPVVQDRPAVLVRQLTLQEKWGHASRQVVTDVGWPLLALSAIGMWRLLLERARDPLGLTLLAWLLAWAGVLAFGTFTRVDTAYQRYAAEFLGRANLAGYPAAVLLTVPALTWGWQRGAPWFARLATGVLVVAAVALGVATWAEWFSAP
jgi:hypothetical protein